MNSIRSTISSVWNGISNTISNVTNRINSTITRIFNGLSNIVRGAFNRVRSAVQNGMTGAYNAVTGFLGRFRTAGSNIVSSIADGIRGAIGKVTSAISNVTSKIRDFLPFSPAKEGALQDIMKTNISGSIAETIKNDGKEPVKAMGKVTKDIAKEMNVKNRLRGTDFNVSRMIPENTAEIITQQNINNKNDALNNKMSELIGVTRKLLNKETQLILDGQAITTTVNERNAILESMNKF